MTHSKHTPGPWAVCSTNCEDVRANGYLLFAGQMPLVDPVAANPEGKANARLIAAAPELLDVAKLLTRACGIQGNLLSTASDPERRELVKIIFEICNEVAAPAIAKAEGGVV